MHTLTVIFWACIHCLLAGTEGISIPFFTSFRQTTTTTQPPPPIHYQQLRDQRIINADHGGVGLPLQSSYAGGNPWISGTKDQFIRNQLVIIHPDSHLNREAWKESGYFNPEYDPTPRKAINASSTPKPNVRPLSRPPSVRGRKIHRKSKHQQHQNDQNIPKQGINVVESTSNAESNVNNQQTVFNGGLYDMPAPVLLREVGEVEEGAQVIPAEHVIFNGNNFLIPITAPFYPYQPRGSINQQEGVIQLLKSPEQELSPLTRPQVKLPFPLSHDCSASGGGGSKPLQFVVLPIVEPVAPLKPIFQKPSFLSSQYGQFPYIPPFNLFKKPPLSPNQEQSIGSGGSGQFVPILNRPAPPLPFVFVQSLPLELIGQNMEMDVLNSAASFTTSENKIKDVPKVPIASVAQPTPSTPPPKSTPAAPVDSIPPIPSSTRPLPLIVIEKVKTPGQPPSSPVGSGATVVEISKQSIPKNSNTNTPPLSTISVVQPITAPGSRPATLKEQQEMQKAIEKLVPVAAAVLENVEQQHLKQQKEQRDRDISKAEEVIPKPVNSDEKIPNVVGPTPINILREQERTPLRAPLRPDTKDSVTGGLAPINTKFQHKKPDISSSEESGGGAVSLTGVEVTEV